MNRSFAIPPLFSLLALLLCALPAWPQADDLKRPEDAFRYAVTDTGSALRIDWTLADGYYLYRDKLSFSTATSGVVLGSPELPKGLRHEDEFFGVQQIYRQQFAVTLPYRLAGTPPKELALTLKSQGCADLGICYPPQTWTTSVEMNAAGQAGGDSATKAEFGRSFGDFGKASSDFLPVDDAFRPMLLPLDGNSVEVSFQVAPGYYLYKDKIAVDARSKRIQVGKLQLPAGEMTRDEYFGETEVYYRDVFAPLPLARATPEAMAIELDISYQGCAIDGICYPPVTRTLAVTLPEATSLAALSPAGDEPMVSKQAQLAALISGAGMWVVLATFFGAGLLLAFTPCVLPMVPILSGIIAGDGKRASPARGFTLALAYVLGMALVYTAAGVVAAAVGVQLQAAFNQPWVLALFAGLFVLLALGMFGAFDLQMPAALQTRMAAISGRQQSGTMIGAFVMGALSSLIVTACVAPPLVAALTVIGQSGNMLRGGAALFALSMGMGAPLLLVGASAGRLLPRAGPWMVAIRNAFGFMMLGLAVWMLSRMLPGAVTLALWGALIFMAGVALGGLTTLTPQSTGARKLGKGAGLLAIIYGAVLLVGALAGSNSLLQPLAGLRTATSPQGTAEAEGLVFQRVKTVAELGRALALAAETGQPAMLDFYADWCVSCKEMEKFTFTDARVQDALAGTLLLQADVTANDVEDQALLQRFGVYGPPTIIFFGADGVQRNGYEVVGYMKAAEFAEHVQRAVGADATTAMTPAEAK